MNARSERVLIKDGTSTERTLRELRNKVLQGELLPGEQVRQEEMAEQMRVSRVPVREALSVLANEGLLTHRRHQGYFVAKRSPEELAQIRLMLGLLEEELVHTLVWPTEEFLDDLRSLNERMAVLAEDEAWVEMVTLNHEFHLKIFGLSPLNLVLGEVKRLWTLADAYIAIDYATGDRRQRTVDQHDKIIKALAAHNRTRLLKAVNYHRDSTDVGARAGITTSTRTTKAKRTA